MSNVESVFSSVIEDVIENVKKDFEDMGVDESTLTALKDSWRKKVISSNTFETYQQEYPQNNSNPGVYPAYSSKPIKYNADYETNNTAANLPIQASTTSTDDGNPMNRGITPYAVAGNNSYQPAPTTSPNNNGFIPNYNQTAQFPPSIQNHNFPDQKVLFTDQKVIQNHQLRQQNQQNQEIQERHLAPRNNRNNMVDNHIPIVPAPTSIQGGIPTFTTPSITVPLEKKRRVTTSLDDDEINSDLDDTDDENENAEGEETKNIILCLYDKVTRTKNKWKCQLKDGVMSVNGKDYLFQKGNGDFEF